MHDRANALIEVIRSRGLKANNLEQVYEWPEDRFQSLIRDFSEVVVADNPCPRSDFAFTANDHLSGAPAPCAGTECRLPPAQEFARFAALYADHVVIRNPFERYSSHQELPLGRLSFRNSMVADIAVVLTFAPLLDAGIVTFSSSQQHWCPVCVYEADRKGELDRFVGAEAAAGWEKRVSKMVEQLRSAFQEQAKGYVFLEDGRTELELTGDHDLIPHGSLVHHSLEVPKSWLRNLRAGGKKLLTPQQLWKSRVLNGHIERIIDDIAIQNHYASVMQTNYITDRAIDLALVDSVNDSATRNLNQTTLTALAHSLPFPEFTTVLDTLKVRNAEGEAFRVYRDALSSTLMSARTGTEKEARQAFADLVRPEINKIDLILRNARGALMKGAATEVGLAIGAVSIALFSGLLPSEWAQIFAALGGASGVKGVATKTVEDFRLPKEVRENRFFSCGNSSDVAAGVDVCKCLRECSDRST